VAQPSSVSGLRIGVRGNEVPEQTCDVQDPFKDRRSVVEMKTDTCLGGATADEKQAGQGRRVEKRQPVEIEMQIRQGGLLGQ
jgi:hypothetical protein